MTSLESTQQGAESAGQQQQPGQQQQQAPVPPGANPAMTNVPGLPPTALAMQMQSLNQQKQQAQQQAQMQAMGAQVTGGPLLINPETPGTAGPQPAGGKPDEAQFGQSSLRDLAEKLARGYGLNFSGGSLVDAEGNFMMTPDQLAGMQQSGDVGNTAASMNYVAQAINDARVSQQQDKATAALQAGAGLLQKRGRGSLAGLQSNFYQAMAQNYTDPNLLPEQQDFSFWIQKEQLDEASDIRSKEDADLGLNGGGAGGGGGGRGGGGADIKSNRSVGNTNPYSPYRSPRATDTGPQGAGDVVTSGPNAGKRPVYTYDPIGKTTTVSWESA